MTAARRPVYLIAEDHALAKPLIDHFALRRTHELDPYTAFANDELLLAESRGDPALVAALVGFLLGSQGADERTRLFHIGRCIPRPDATIWSIDRGFDPPDAEGQLPQTALAPNAPHVQAASWVAIVNRVVDPHRRRALLPDILLSHEFPEISVASDELPPAPQLGSSPRSATRLPEPRTTTPGESGGARLPPYLDRELSGFLVAAQAVLAPHQIYCLAAVDPDGGKRGDRDPGREALEGALEAIGRLIAASGELLLPLERRRIDRESRELVEQVARTLRLTASQGAELLTLSESIAARGDSPARVLSRWCNGTAVQSKEERRRRFNELKRDLEA